MIMHACMYRRTLHYIRLHYTTLHEALYSKVAFPGKFYHARNVFKKNARACDFNESLMRLRDRSYFTLEFLCKSNLVLKSSWQCQFVQSILNISSL